ncbi:MAG TPA: DUF1259 domain-containing protein [Gemmatimonadaceae bacterium]|nr:DUF1259 domain-containing protein [Gemmatimonadaceae bacterium]
MPAFDQLFDGATLASSVAHPGGMMKGFTLLQHNVSSVSALVFITLISVPFSVQGQNAPRPAAGWSGVEQILGKKGSVNAGGGVKFGFPRSDLLVRLDNVTIKPALALGGWVAFKGNPNGQSTVMGDLVLLENEATPVMRALQAGGVEQTAVHNHLLREQPHVIYMHIHARGNSQAIARTIRNALGQTKTPFAASPSPAAAPPSDLDTVAIASTLRVAGKWNGGVYQVSVPRRETITDDGMEVPPSMGVATGINFQPTGGGKAAITGDFVLRAGEVNPVIRALGANGIEVTALHTHMLTEQPKLFFMHFWANSDAVKLARGLGAALDKTASKR